MNNLMNKPVNEITVGDSLKLQGIALGITAGFIALGLGVSAVSEKIRIHRLQKKVSKVVNAPVAE